MENEKNKYCSCTDNKWHCDTCSLVSYGRDCHNEAIEADPMERDGVREAGHALDLRIESHLEALDRLYYATATLNASNYKLTLAGLR